MDNSLFLGQYEHSIDGKGRVILPAKYRERFSGGMVFRSGEDRCLLAYPMEDWLKEAEKIRSLSERKRVSREYRRWFFGRSSECQPDKQGRVMVPPNMRNYAGLDKDILIVGVYDRLEIWDKNTWHKREPIAEGEIENIAEGLEE